MTLVYACNLNLPDAWFDELLRRVPSATIVHIGVDGEGFAECAAEVDFLHTTGWLPDPLTAPKLKAVQLDTSGVDHVLDTPLWRSGVPIATLGGIAPVPMAEYTMMSVLALAHRMYRVNRWVADHTWPEPSQRLLEVTPQSLSGRTMCILGYGRIGREIGRLARAFNLHVIGINRTGGRSGGVDRFRGSAPVVSDDDVEVYSFEGLDEALSRSDVLVVVLPLTPSTRNMVDERRLQLLRDQALVVNVSRGGIVDEAALLSGLRAGRIHGAALDVFNDEPLEASSHWWTEPGVLVTPHIAGLAPRYLDETLELIATNLRRVAEGKPILNEVSRAAGY